MMRSIAQSTKSFASPPCIPLIVKKNTNEANVIQKIAVATSFNEAHRTLENSKGKPSLAISKALLHKVRNTQEFRSARIVWQDIKRSQIIPDLQCFGMLVYSASKAKDTNMATELWQAISSQTYTIKPTTIDCSQLIQTFAQQIDHTTLSSIWQYMKHDLMDIDPTACVCILNACRTPERLDIGISVHDYSKQYISSNSESNSQKLILVTSIINMYLNCGKPEKAISVWNDISQTNIFLNQHVYCTMFSVCAHLKNSLLGEQIYNHMLHHRIVPDIACYNALINMYVKCGHAYHAISIWHRVEKDKRVQPNIVTYTNTLIACGETGNISLGKEVHELILAKNISWDSIIDSSLIKMYSDCGSIEAASDIFENSRDCDRMNVIVWTTYILALAQHGEAQRALEIFEEISTQVTPNSQTFLAVLVACSHTQMVDKALEVYETMQEQYNITPTLDHNNTMIDVLSRAGKLREAEEFALGIASPDLVTWKTILGACRTHYVRSTECTPDAFDVLACAERAAANALAINPQDAATYVLLSNIYAYANMRDKSKMIRAQMEDNGVKKEPGKSWIEVNGNVSYFLVNDKTHPLTTKIYQKIEEMKTKLRSRGYKSETCFVTQDVDEEQKKDLLWYHSEKLALAYGFVSLPPSQPITIIKNLRVCGDCHKALEYVSKLYKREIYVRDANRFHHFRDGKCSCNGVY